MLKSYNVSLNDSFIWLLAKKELKPCHYLRSAKYCLCDHTNIIKNYLYA